MRTGHRIMPLLFAFIALAVAGQALNMFIAIMIERHVSEAAGVMVFFALLAVVFIAAWKVAVRLTEPAAQARALGQRLG